MNEFIKLKELYEEIDVLIAQKVTASDISFITWQKKLGRFLIKKYGENSKEYSDFNDRSFSPVVFSLNGYKTDYISPCKRGLEITKAELSIYIEELEESLFAQSLSEGAEKREKPTDTHFLPAKTFIVHGHNEALKQSVARLIEKQGIEPIILHEQPNKGATIIEKFEHNSNVGAAICLFTADDNGRAITEEQVKKRARQNVVFEAGFFMGSLGRDRVIILAERGVELPSDLKGVVYTDTSSWQLDVLRELRAMGFSVDYNKID